MTNPLALTLLAISICGVAYALNPENSTSPASPQSHRQMRDQLLQNCLEYDSAMEKGDWVRARQEQFQIQRNLRDLNTLVEEHYLQTQVRPGPRVFSQKVIITNPSQIDIPYETAKDLDPDTGTYYYLRRR
jgi:hypothetical protein